MKLRLFSVFLFVFAFALAGVFAPAYAHDAPLDEDGCHECAEGCDFWNYWSVPLILRHCHGRPAPTSFAPKEPLDVTTFFLATSTVIGVPEGDVLEVVFYDGTEAEVQLIGAQDPETHESHASSSCQATRSWYSEEEAKMLLLDQEVLLRRDDPENRDEAGRLLRSVFFGGALVNEKFLEEGAFYFQGPVASSTLQARLMSAEARAEADGAGLWSTDFCETHRRPLVAVLSGAISGFSELPVFLRILLLVAGLVGIYFFAWLMRGSRRGEDATLEVANKVES